MLGLNIIDIVVVFLYFSIVFYIGYKTIRKVQSEVDFFLGGRRFGKAFQTFSMFGQATSSESAVQSISMVVTNGLAGAVLSIINAISLYPVSWMFPKWLRRLRLMSLAEYFYDRFNSRKLAVLYAIAQSALFLMVGGMGLYAMSKTICAITEKPIDQYTESELKEHNQALRLEFLEKKPAELLTNTEKKELETLRYLKPQKNFSYVDKNLLIIFIAFFVFLYATGGGLKAAVYTDFLQSIFIIILTILLLPFAMIKLNSTFGTAGFLGPFNVIHTVLPESMFEIFGSPMWVEFTWYNVIIIMFINLAGNIAFSNNLVVSGAARTEKIASFGGLTGFAIKGFGSLMWMLLALFILGLFGEFNTDPDLLWGYAARTLLPVGLLGLLIACLMAALMSTASTHMMTVSGLLAHNIYKYFVPGKSENHYVNAGRVLGLVYILGAIFFALNTDSIFHMWKFMILINVCCGPAMLMGFIWRRTNTKAVWYSMGISLLLTVFIPILVMFFPSIRYSPNLLLESKSEPIVKVYTASKIDVEERKKLISEWEILNKNGLAKGEKPKELTLNEKFEKIYYPPSKAIFWDEGIKLDKDGRYYGNGFFKPEMYLIYLAGVKLESYSPAKVESISLLCRLLFPFLVIFIVGYFTKPMDKLKLDRFYAKLRTPVDPDLRKDELELKITYENPERFNHYKLFPNSNWEFDRWEKYDIKGMILAFTYGIIQLSLVIAMGYIGK
ncbi:MAG TPA: sodium:solute symporter family protein [Bacteroidota bacterium]|nr:sodium:solute symporter family protein [Bacteroidota bacterium]